MAAMDFIFEESLAKSMDRAEKLYQKGEWDEVMRISRGVLKDAPKSHPSKQRAQDLIVLSLDGKNKELIRKQNIQKLKKNKSTAKTLVDEGNKLLIEKKYESAAGKFSRAVRYESGDSQSYYLLGYALKKSGNKKGAYNAFKKCLSLNKNHSRALFHLTGLSYEFKKNREAEILSKKLIFTIEKRLEELKEIFFAQKEQQLNDKAIETTRKMASLKQNLAQATYMHGVLTEKRKDYKAALESFRKASQLNSASADVWYHLGKVLLNLNIYHQATLALEQSAFIKESRLKELRDKATQLLDSGKDDQAVAAELETRKIKAEIAKSYYALAVANGKRKETGTAIENINKAIELDPELSSARYVKAVFLAEKNRFEEALIEMRKVLKNAPPKSVQAKKAIKTMTFLMDMIARKNNPVEFAKIEKKSKTVEVNSYVKDMPGLGGKKKEVEWEEIFPQMKEIQELVTMANYPEAIRRLIYLRTKHPNIAEIHAILGNCYSIQGRYEDAELCFENAIEIQPSHAESLANLAYVYATLGKKLNKAQEMAEKALKADGLRAEFHHTLGWVLFKTGEVKKAMLSFSKAVEIKPDYILARYNLGLSHYILREYKSALDSFDFVLAKNPSHQKALLFKAISQAKTNEAEKALQTLEYLGDKLPEKSTLAKVVSDLHSKLKLAHERHAKLPIPEIQSPAPIEKLMAEAAAYRRDGLVTKAKEKYLECQRLAPERFEPYYELGEMYAKAGLNTPAVSTWQKAIAMNPNNYELQLNLGKMLHKLGKVDKARECFVKAQALGEKEAEPKYYLGLLAYEDKKFESAESHALGALRLKPRFFKSMALLGMARIRLGRLKPARDIYETLYAKAPNNSSIKQHARTKIWEITKMMAPAQFPSIEDAMDVKETIVKRVSGEKDNKKFVPQPSDEKSFKEYGKNTMTVDDKLWVLRQMEKFSSISTPSPVAPLRKTITAETLTSKEKNWMLNRLKGFGAHSNKYALPVEKGNKEFALKTIKVAQRAPDKSDEFTKKGLENAEKGFLAKALEDFEKARTISPENLEVLLNLGFLHTIQGNFKNAFDAFAQASISHPESPLPHLALGNLYWLGGQASQAINSWKKIKGPINPDPEFTFIARSEKVWKRMLEINPTDIDAHSNLGMVFLFAGKTKEALAEFQAVTSLDKNRKEHDFYSAQAYVILFITEKNKQYKNNAKEILASLVKGPEPFPHTERLSSFVKSL